MLYECKHEWVIVGGVVGTAHRGRDGSLKDFRPGEVFVRLGGEMYVRPARGHRGGSTLRLGEALQVGVGPMEEGGYAVVTCLSAYRGVPVVCTVRGYVGPVALLPKLPSELAREKLTAIIAEVDVPALWESATHRQRGRALYSHREGKRLAALEAILTPLLPKELLSVGYITPQRVVELNMKVCKGLLEGLDAHHRAQIELRKAAYLLRVKA